MTAVLTGKVGGVTKLIRGRYNKASYFHCARHRLNVVINKFNKIIRHTISTKKEIIKFYRESTYPSKKISYTQFSIHHFFCETRWSSK